MTKISYLFLLFVVFSCGKKSHDGDDKKLYNDLTPDGTFKAVLKSSNLKISKDIYGEAKVLKYGDDFKVYVHLKNAKGGVYHQHLQTGVRCPKVTDDKNGDNIIDKNESMKLSGLSIIPFDDDLASQKEGRDLKLQGNYHYERSTSYYLMLTDLHEPDVSAYDSIIKLEEKELILDNKVIVVYQSKIKFNTVEYSDIPIACGQFIRLSDAENWGEIDSWAENSANDIPNYSNTKPPPVSTFSSPPYSEEDNTVEVEVEEHNDDENHFWWDRISQRWRRFVTSVNRWLSSQDTN